MDKLDAISKYKSHPDIQKILKMVIKDKNWVYDLFDVVKQNKEI